MSEEKVTKIEDANLVAFLTMKGFIAIPYISKEEGQGRSSRIAWDVQGDVEARVKDFYGNEQVGVYDFVKALKDVRTEMYNMKQMNNQLKKM